MLISTRFLCETLGVVLKDDVKPSRQFPLKLKADAEDARLHAEADRLMVKPLALRCVYEGVVWEDNPPPVPSFCHGKFACFLVISTEGGHGDPLDLPARRILMHPEEGDGLKVGDRTLLVRKNALPIPASAPGTGEEWYVDLGPRGGLSKEEIDRRKNRYCFCREDKHERIKKANPVPAVLVSDLHSSADVCNPIKDIDFDEERLKVDELKRQMIAGCALEKMTMEEDRKAIAGSGKEEDLSSQEALNEYLDDLF